MVMVKPNYDIFAPLKKNWGGLCQKSNLPIILVSMRQSHNSSRNSYYNLCWHISEISFLQMKNAKMHPLLPLYSL